jgi:D-3-phosphoglycerate dehydrogenase / 2-oxoglutarate reductase
MDVLIVEPLDPEVLHWLGTRHAVRYAPELAQDPRAFRKALWHARAVLIPPSVALDTDTLLQAPLLRAVGRVSAGAENIDLEACSRAGIEVVRPVTASASAEAEFVIGSLLQMLRRVPVINAEGLLVGRELGDATVGIIGMAPAAKPLAQLLGAFGAHVLGYDPALHASDPLWARWQVQPTGLSDLFERCDGVAVMLTYFSRYRGLLGERFLSVCKPNQVLVSLAHSSLFDELALADALTNGRLAAAWFDSMEPGVMDPGRPLRHIDTLQITPHVASTTLQSRVRGAWDVARRTDEILGGRPAPAASSAVKPSAADDLADLADGPAPA